MSKRKYSHIHQYHKTYPGGISSGPFKTRAQWECALAECSHFIPRNMSEPVGKASLCNECMSTMTLDEDNMKMDKPLCNSCANPDAVLVPEDFNFERYEARSFIATKTGRELADITEAEIERQIQVKRLFMKEQK